MLTLSLTVAGMLCFGLRLANTPLEMCLRGKAEREKGKALSDVESVCKCI